MAVPLRYSPTIVMLKGIMPSMKTRKHKERKHQCAQRCLRVKQPLSPPACPATCRTTSVQDFNTSTLDQTYIMQLIVEATGVAHWVSICVAPPECGGGRLAVSTTGACSSGCRLRTKICHNLIKTNLFEQIDMCINLLGRILFYKIFKAQGIKKAIVYMLICSFFTPVFYILFVAYCFKLIIKLFNLFLILQRVIYAKCDSVHELPQLSHPFPLG